MIALPDQVAQAATARGAAPASNVVPLVAPKRGRPKRAAQTRRPCADTFDTVRVAVIGLAQRASLWNRVKDWAHLVAARDKALSPTSRSVLTFFLTHVNREHGYDWHSAAAIARDLSLSPNSVNRAFGELAAGGYILREEVAVRGTHASRQWRTTVPVLVEVAGNIAAEREAKAHRGAPQENGQAPPRKIGEGPPENAEGLPKQMAEGPPKIGEQTFIGKEDNCFNEPVRCAPSDGSRVQIVDAQIRIVDDLWAFWLERFGGDAGRLDLALIEVAGRIQPNSSRPLEAQVSSQLARIAAERHDRDRRYAAAAAKSGGNGGSYRERKIVEAQAFGQLAAQVCERMVGCVAP